MLDSRAVAAPRAVAGEATRLRRLLGERLPDYERAAVAVELADDDPPAIRAFWAATGWYEPFADFRLHRPEAELARTVVPALLAEHGAAGDWLPKRYRLVDVDPDGFGFRITDEDRRPDDPPVLGVSFDPGADLVEQEHPRYLVWCANAMLAAAHDSWHRSGLKPGELSRVARGEVPFHALSPVTRCLDEDLWAVPAHAGVAEFEEHCCLVHREPEALDRWRQRTA